MYCYIWFANYCLIDVYSNLMSICLLELKQYCHGERRVCISVIIIFWVEKNIVVIVSEEWSHQSYGYQFSFLWSLLTVCTGSDSGGVSCMFV